MKKMIRLLAILATVTAIGLWAAPVSALAPSVLPVFQDEEDGDTEEAEGEEDADAEDGDADAAEDADAEGAEDEDTTPEGGVAAGFGGTSSSSDLTLVTLVGVAAVAAGGLQLARRRS